MGQESKEGKVEGCDKECERTEMVEGIRFCFRSRRREDVMKIMRRGGVGEGE